MNNNKLIAEFMGLEYAPKDKRWDDWFDKDNNRITFGNRIPLQYHSSWDWLMPVIEEIEKIGYKFEKNYQPIDKDWQSLIVKGNDILYQQFNDDSLKSSYDVVVDFIEDYNKIK